MATLRFTLVCDFDGGTYVSQVQAADECHAIKEWAAHLRRELPIERLSARIADEAAGSSDRLVAVTGLAGVWCWTACVDDKLVLTNIVHSA